MVRINKIGIKQTAKFFAVFYFLISLVFVIPMALITILVSAFGGNNNAAFGGVFGGIVLIALPVAYAVMGYLIIALFGLIYNALAKRIGGVEIEIDSENPNINSNVQNTSPVAS